MFCVNCGVSIPEGEMLCKGCSKLSANLRDEILAMSEKSSSVAADLKCEKCGGAIEAEHHYCNTCGEPIAC